MIQFYLNGFLLVALLTSAGCKRDKEADATYWPEGTIENCTKENPLHIPGCKLDVGKDKVYVNGDKKFLWAGENPSTHFDISDWCLNECQLHYGLGREHFKALIHPDYGTVAEEDRNYQSSDRFMIVEGAQEPRVYSISLLTRHEIINDTIDGNPYMVGYCVLADLAAVYTRIYCGQEYTFGVSGYTYFDKQVWKGLDGFLIWDRETESLWWPLIDKAVSGAMKGQYLKKYDDTKWRETTWGEIVTNHPKAWVMRKGQTMETPTSWPSKSGC